MAARISTLVIARGGSGLGVIHYLTRLSRVWRDEIRWPSTQVVELGEFEQIPKSEQISKTKKNF